MQKFGKTIITDSGRKMLVEVDGAKGQLTYTRAALFKQDIKGLSEDDQIALTELIGQQIETPLKVTQIQDTTVTVSASFNNSKVSQDLPFNTIGWYAKTSVDNVEQLMAVTPSLTEQTLVAGVEGASTSALDIDMVFGRSHNTTVVLSPNQAGVVSAPQLAASIQKLKIELKELGLLNDSDGNNIYNTIINLDTYSTVGITKFLECKLQSSGKMSGFDQAADKLYGWIFNVPKWNGATEFQQIVYICDFGQGTLRYVRSRVNNEGKNKEDFEKVLTDKDLQKAINSFGQTKSVNGVKPDNTGNIDLSEYFGTLDKFGSLYGMTNAGVKKIYSNQTFNPDTITETGAYKIVSCTVNTKVDDVVPNGTQWGWLIVLNYDETNITNALYQLLIINEKIYRRVVSLQYQTFPSFKSLGQDITVNSIKPDSNGNIAIAIPDNTQNTSDITDLKNQVTELSQREIIHQCDDITTGTDYSKAHPNVIVGTP